MTAFWICQPPESSQSLLLCGSQRDGLSSEHCVRSGYTGYPNPLSKTVGCEQDQNPDYTRPPSRIRIPTRS